MNNSDRPSDIVYIVAHELLSPLTAVKGLLSMMINDETGELPERTKTYLKDSIMSSERMIRMVNNLLNISKIEEGHLDFNLTSVSVSPIVRSVHMEFEHEAKQKNLMISVNVGAALKDTVSADSDKLHEVISNLVSNSIKYTQEGHVDISLENIGNKLRVKVKDTGVGIPDAEQPRIFEKFYRAKSNNLDIKGIGLGLYLAKVFVEKFGGSLSFTSKVGVGSEFWFDLPLV